MSRHGATLQPWRWLGAPAALAVAATVILGAPVRVAGIGLPEPVFPLALAFSWAVIRPSASGPLLLLALGAFLDFFWNARMGLWGLSLICAYGLSLAGRSLMAGQGLVVMGGWYAAVCCLGLGVAYLFATIGAHEQPSIVAAVWQLAWTLGLYPAVAYMVDRFEDADVRFR